MSTNLLIRPLTLLFMVVLVAPAVFFMAPPRAAADGGGGCVGGLIGGAIAELLPVTDVPATSKSGNIINGETAGATVGTCINDLILVPLARAAMRSILQGMTSSVLGWITGKTNSTGSPQFVTDLQGNLQKVGDTQALAFLAQFSANSNSPFSAAITSSLSANYFQQTSLKGFFGSNTCTLPQYSANPQAYLKGDWSQGGTDAWFALTTQDQNNPFGLYHNSQSELSGMATNATAARQQELTWGQGFASWCGPYDASTASTAGNNPDEASATSVGVNPGDPCTNSTNGAPGTIETPGSIIHDYTQKAVVASGFDQVLSAQDIDNALSSLVGTLLTQVLGNGSGGLLGSTQPSSTGGSAVTTQLQNYSSSNVSATGNAFQTAQSILNQISTYAGSWGTISAAATTASTSLMKLSDVCTTAADTAATVILNQNSFDTPSIATPATLSATHSVFIDAARAQAAAAQAAIPAQIIPVLTQAQAGTAAVTDTQAFALKIESEASGLTVASSPTSLATDVATLVAMPPSATDVALVQSNATAGNTAAANPSGSLNVSQGTLIDKMNLLSTNAATLQTTVCNPSSSLYATNTGN